MVSTIGDAARPEPGGGTQCGDRAGHQALAIGRVEEGEADRLARRRAQRVGRDHAAARLGAAGGDVGAQRGEGGAVALDEGRGGGAAGQRLQPERAGAGESVEHGGALDQRTSAPWRVQQHVEQRLAQPVGGRTGGGAGRRGE